MGSTDSEGAGGRPSFIEGGRRRLERGMEERR
jgi:hypothetical protein